MVVREKSVTPAMKEVAAGKNLESSEEVKQFWRKSTQDYIDSRPTGIDIAGVSDWYWHFLDKWEKDTALQFAQGNSILDLGCGTGRLTRHLLSNGRNVTSVDYVEESLEVVRREVSGAHCLLMDSTNLSLPDASFDCVIACRVLCSSYTLEEKEQAVAEIARVLRKGGRLVLTEGNPLRQRFVRIPYNFFLSLGEWTKLLRKYGLAVQTVRGIPFLTFSKALDRLSFGFLSRFRLPFQIAFSLDKLLAQFQVIFLSLQFDIIAVRETK